MWNASSFEADAQLDCPGLVADVSLLSFGFSVFGACECIDDAFAAAMDGCVERGRGSKGADDSKCLVDNECQKRNDEWRRRRRGWERERNVEEMKRLSGRVEGR